MNFDYADMPAEIWCDLAEESGVSTDDLRELLQFVRADFNSYGYDRQGVSSEWPRVRGDGLFYSSIDLPWYEYIGSHDEGHGEGHGFND